MDVMDRNLGGVESYIKRIDALSHSLCQELGVENLIEDYSAAGTWFSESTIRHFYELKDDIWATELRYHLEKFLENEPGLSEKLKTDIENEVMLLKDYSDDIQRERAEDIPTPDEFFFVKSTRTNMPLEKLAQILSKTDILEPLVCEFNQSYEWKDYSKDYLVEPEHKMIPEGDKYLRIWVPADAADVHNLYGYLTHKLEFLSNTHNADLVDTLVLHNNKYMDSVYTDKAVTLTKYDSIDDMIKHLEKDGNSIENQARAQRGDNLERKETKRPSLMDRLAQNIEKVKARNAEQSGQPTKEHDRSERNER